MIISGGSRNNWRYFAKHLMKTEENERVHVAEIRGLIADNVYDAFREMDALALGTKVTNSFYHADVNPRESERLTEEQWGQAIDTLETNLGLQGQARFVVEHEKEGRVHRHVVWSRIDLDTMQAIPDSWDYKRHQQTSRDLEKALGLEPVNGVLGPDGKRVPRRPKNWEVMRGDLSGIDPKAVETEITALYRQADTGQAFAAALEQHGYVLARGDRRDFLIVDRAGDEHSLARRVEGAKAADIRARMAGIDREALPTLKEAKAIARSRRAERDRDDEATQPDSARPADPAPKRDDGALEVVAEALVDVALEALAGKEAKPVVAEAAKTESTAFDHVAEELAHEAKEPGTVAEALAVAAAVMEGAHIAEEPVQATRDPAAEANPLMPERPVNPVERMGRQFLANMREGPPVAFSVDWQAWPDQVEQAMRSRGGDGPSSWRRGLSALAAMRDRLTGWLRDSFQRLTARLFPERNDRNKGFER